MAYLRGYSPYTAGVACGVGRGDTPPSRATGSRGLTITTIWNYHSRVVFKTPRVPACTLARCIASAGSVLPRFWLQSRCASLTFVRSYGLPPSETGSISSISGLWGVPGGAPVSTLSPHSQQFVSSLSTLRRSLFRLVLLVRRGLVIVDLTFATWV